MKKTGLTTVAATLPDLFGRKNWHFLWQTFSLCRRWSDIAGREIAGHTRPAYISNRTLWIEVSGSVWMQHLQMMKQQLLDRIREAVPDAGITDLRWVMKPPERRAETSGDTERENAGQADPVQAEAFRRIASTIENRECRDALYKLWITFHQHDMP